jgi:integrative and conjugative element protein (TIGR02256 family)
VASLTPPPGRLPDMRTPVIRLAACAAETIATEAPESVDGSETGGILLGHDRVEAITVTRAGDPGPRADRRPDGFLRDLTHSRVLADKAYDQDGSVWVGEWHTHPSGLGVPSSIDEETYGRLLAEPELGFTRLASIIVTPCPKHGWSELMLAAWIADADGMCTARLEVVDGLVAEAIDR